MFCNTLCIFSALTETGCSFLKRLINCSISNGTSVAFIIAVSSASVAVLPPYNKCTMLRLLRGRRVTVELEPPANVWVDNKAFMESIIGVNVVVIVESCVWSTAFCNC